MGFSIARGLDYLQLAKPRIAVMAMTAVAVGYLLGARGEPSLLELLSACFGIGCVAVACSFLNQWLEQDTDSLMPRTSERPVPCGRISATEVLATGLVLTAVGVTWLWLTTNVVTSVLAAVTLAVYVCVYTPLKRVSSLCTTVGAVAGALPPVLGWTAAGGSLDGGAASLFLLLFAWQFPHFLAIATIYREDYETAGLKMLPMANGTRNFGGVVGFAYACVLIPISLIAWQEGLVGQSYVVVALIGGVVYLVSSWRFMLDQSKSKARELVLASIVYLPTILVTMTVDHYRLLSW